MISTIDRVIPTIQSEAHGAIDQALQSRGIDSESPVRTDLLKRVRVLSACRNAVIRFTDNDRNLVPAEACLDQLLNGAVCSADSRTGPLKISMTDKQALFVASEEVARGSIIVTDNRTHPR
jgi:hypothetical protein